MVGQCVVTEGKEGVLTSLMESGDLATTIRQLVTQLHLLTLVYTHCGIEDDEILAVPDLAWLSGTFEKICLASMEKESRL